MQHNETVQGICSRDKDSGKLIIQVESLGKVFIPSYDEEIHKIQVGDTVRGSLFVYITPYLSFAGRMESGTVSKVDINTTVKPTRKTAEK